MEKSEKKSPEVSRKSREVSRKSREVSRKSRETSDTVQDTLENLIEQFSDVFCFYRELVQNSLDAGSNRVDMYLEFQPIEGGDEGIMLIHVDDYGEGMNREIIDTQLTRLFSSSKEGDYTKIGKFGIGFVSVFAIQPDAVNIDTSRDGEDWRILFDREKRFERIKREQPVDGTRIQIIKKTTRAEFDKFRKKSEETIAFWCKHAEADIYFESRLINKPFDVISPCKIFYSTPGTEVVMGYTTDSPPAFGFYNRGLTLLEGRERYFRNITFKIRSHYLEHTLTRDNVIHDDNYEKAIAILEELTRGPLRNQLYSNLDEALNRGDRGLYEKLVGFIDVAGEDLKNRHDELYTIRIFPSVDGERFSVSHILRAKGHGKRLYFDHLHNSITRELIKKGHLVAAGAEEAPHLEVLQKIACRLWNREKLNRASDSYYLPEIFATSSLPPGEKRFLEMVCELVQGISRDYRKLYFGSFDYEGSSIRDRLCVVQEKEGQISPVEEQKKALFGLFERSRIMVINRNHLYVRDLLAFAGKDPGLAAYLFVKMLIIRDGIHPRIDSKLISLSLSMQGVK